MEKVQEIIRKNVVKAFNEYKDYIELSNKENKVKNEYLDKIQKLFKEDENDPEIKDYNFEVFMLGGFHRRDAEILGKKFLNYATLYKELPQVKELDEEIESTYKYLKEMNREQVFIVKNGKFEEINKGFIEERRKIFEEKNLFETTKKELEKYFE